MLKVDYALQLAAQGFYVFPCYPNDKRPRGDGWQARSTRSPEQIRAMWSNFPDDNIGIDCEKSGLVIIDIDNKNGKNGSAAVSEWQAAHGQFTGTVTAETPSGGYHLYYRGQAVKGVLGLCGGSVDIRSKGNLVIAPGSEINGKLYKWIFDPVQYMLAPFDGNQAAFYFSETTQAEERQPKFGLSIEDIADGNRHDTFQRLCGSLNAIGIPADIQRIICEQVNDRIADPLSQADFEHTIAPMFGKWEPTNPWWQKRVIDQSLLERVKKLDPANDKQFGLNDAGNARLFIAACGDRVLYLSDRARWVGYDGRRWNTQDDAPVRELLKQLADCMMMYTIQGIQDESRRTELLKHYGKWQQLKHRETILKDAQSVKPVTSDIFDRNPYLYNCQNGTLNIDTREFKAHDPKDFISKIANVSYDPAAKSERWIRFIDEIMCYKQDRARYLQKVAGLTPTGVTKYECFWIEHGSSSRNGKSTLNGTIGYMHGDYAVASSVETFIKKKFSNGSAPTSDRARLAGARFVYTTEPQRGFELDSAFIKSLTGGDKISARNLREKDFEYVADCKLMINSNHLPKIDDMAIFASDRVRLILFERHFTEQERDLNLKDELTRPDNLSGILNWCLDGYAMLKKEGLKEPDDFKAALEEYRMKSDKMRSFLQEKCENGDDFEVTQEILFSAFNSWCIGNGQSSVGLPRFREMIDEAGYQTKRKRPAGTGRAGVMQVYVLRVRLKAEMQETA